MINKPPIIISIAILLLIIGTFEALLFFRVLDPPWNPFRPSPEETLFQMIDNLNNIESVNTTVQITASLTQDAIEVFDFSISISSNNQTRNDQKLGQGEISGEFNLEGISIDFDAEYRVIDDTVYFKIKTFPALSYLQAIAGVDNLEELRNQWIEIDTKDISDQLGPESEQKSKETLDELIEDLQRLAQEKKLLEDLSYLADETIGGVKTYHLTLTLQNEGFLELFTQAILRETADSDPASASLYTSQILDGALDEVFGAFGDVPVDVWIGKSDFLPYRVRIEKNLSAEDLTSMSGGLSMQGSIFLAIQVDAIDYNVPITVDVPENTKTLEEIFSSTVLGSSLFGARSKARDARILADLGQYRSLAEISYSNVGDYSNVGIEEDFKTLEKDIVIQGGTNFSVFTNPSNSEYCAEVQLNGGDWYCVDSTFLSKRFNLNPACTLTQTTCE
ncbi:hypothetical protein IID24_00820 [Patescibacteria group bacterium]|nr:hypothetical protein [Patescibacteria group bacterium]